LLIVLSIVGLGLWWRYASRKRQLPCPIWLAKFLDNPFTETIAGTRTTLERINLQPGERGLDVGSGPGRLAIPASHLVGPQGEVVAIDVQQEMLARLEQRARDSDVTNLRAILSDISKDPPLPEGYFDRAWLVTVLGEIPDRHSALRNIYKSLKPGGILSITEIFPDPHYQSLKTVLHLVEQAGFIPEQKWGNPLAFTLNCRKHGGDGEHAGSPA
jgi:ubiquinone/menaquinone biosynthesis C-methylase UbiE